MSYITISKMARDDALAARCKAAAATEIVANNSKSLEPWMEYGGMDTPMWYLAAQPGWAGAWESAIANELENIGANPAVITDGMILSAVQTLV